MFPGGHVLIEIALRTTVIYAVVLPGVTVPAGVLFAGVPGRVVRELTDEDRAGFAHTAAHYVDRAARHRAASWRETPDCARPRDS